MNNEYFNIDRLYEKEIDILKQMNIFISENAIIYQLFYEDDVEHKNNEIITQYYYRLLAYQKENNMMLLYVNYQYGNNGDCYDIIHGSFNEISNKIIFGKDFKKQIKIFELWLETNQLDTLLGDKNSKKVTNEIIKL